MIAFRPAIAYGFSKDSWSTVLNGSRDKQIEDNIMVTYAKAMIRPQLILAVFLVAGFMIVSGRALAAAPAGETRLSITTQNTKERRDNGIDGGGRKHRAAH